MKLLFSMQLLHTLVTFFYYERAVLCSFTIASYVQRGKKMLHYFLRTILFQYICISPNVAFRVRTTERFLS